MVGPNNFTVKLNIPMVGPNNLTVKINVPIIRPNYLTVKINVQTVRPNYFLIKQNKSVMGVIIQSSVFLSQGINVSLSFMYQELRFQYKKVFDGLGTNLSRFHSAEKIPTLILPSKSTERILRIDIV